MIRLLALVTVLAIGLAACAPSSHILVGAARPPISPSEVKLYLQPPPTFEQIAVLNASSNSMFGTGGQGSVDKVIQRLKVEAAKVGANDPYIQSVRVGVNRPNVVRVVFDLKTEVKPSIDQ